MRCAILSLISLGLVAGAPAGEEACPPTRLQDAEHWVGRPVGELIRHCGRPDSKRTVGGQRVLTYKLKIYLPDDAGPFVTGESKLWIGGSVLPEESDSDNFVLFYAPMPGEAGNRVAGVQRVEVTVADDTVRDVETRPIAWKRRIRRQMDLQSPP